MNNPYDIHAWSLQYRAQAWREARTCHLLKRSRAGGQLSSKPGLVGPNFKSVLGSLVRGTKLAG